MAIIYRFYKIELKKNTLSSRFTELITHYFKWFMYLYDRSVINQYPPNVEYGYLKRGSEFTVTQDKTYFEKYGLDLFKISILEVSKFEFKELYDLKINPHKYNLGIIEYIKA